jgi:hypothetical protein
MTEGHNSSSAKASPPQNLRALQAGAVEQLANVENLPLASGRRFSFSNTGANLPGDLRDDLHGRVIRFRYIADISRFAGEQRHADFSGQAAPPRMSRHDHPSSTAISLLRLFFAKACLKII